VTPFSRQDHEVECVRALYLDPACTAPAGFIGRVERFRNDTFVTACERVFEEARCNLAFGRHHAGNEGVRWNGAFERREPFLGGTVHQRFFFQQQAVEKEYRKRNLAA
jgi:hypothetical protein